MSQMPPSKTQYFPLVGGLDAESAQLAMTPGAVIGCLNYESSPLNGYVRIGGYERFDGRPRPSDATYKAFQSATGFSGASVGNTVTGATSSATAKVLALRGANQIVVTRIAGTFTYGEVLNVGGSPVGELTQDASDINGYDENTFLSLAAADYRADIGVVPGSGPIRGIAVLGSTLYAWRDNAVGSECDIHKSTASGWVKVTLYRELAFTAGSVAPTEGSTVTKGASSATVKRVVLEDGSWDAGTAQGRLIITTPATEFTAGAFTTGITATASGASTRIMLLVGGKLDHVVYSFIGLADSQKIYGADGINRGFEFDGDVFVPINTGMVVDAPTHCIAHRNHLFFSFAGSLQHSAIGFPYKWSAVVGAGEISAGDVITGFHSLPSDSSGGALMVLTANRTSVLYGSSSANWSFQTFSDNVGAQRWSTQSLGRVIVYDTLGIATISQSQSFGNFERLPLSAKIQRVLTGRMTTASTVNRATKCIRLFFASGDSLSISPVVTKNGEMLSFMKVNYGKVVNTTCEAIINGEHRNFFGSDDGFVYESDRGRSFDGAEIFSFLKLAFNHIKSPMEKKRFRRADIEIKTESACSILVHGEYDLGHPDVGLTNVVDVTRPANGAYFDATNFDESFFDTPRHGVGKVRLDGVGTTLSLSVVSRQSTEMPHTLQSMSLVFTPRRLDR